MRTLSFIVDKKIIKKDPNCNFGGLIPGTEGYLQAKFIFSHDWDGCVKVAGFSSKMGKEYKPQILKDGCTCMIPAEALSKVEFKIQVVGKKEDLTLTTNKIAVKQNGGKE